MSAIFQNWPHRWFCWGSFTTERSPFPAFEDLVDETWQPQDKSQLVQYLKMAPVVLCTSAEQDCRICGNPLEEVGTWRWDNMWLWPQTVAHYVEKHFVRLPDKMVDDIRSRNYMPPSIAECDHLKADAVLSALDDLTSRFG
jgi:hypothetical protein